jgi:hypothetical protein
VGFARVDITPAGSIDMGGYIARKEPAAGTHDPLSVKAISLGYDNRSAMLLSFELLHLSSDWCRMTKHSIAKKLDIPPTNILLSATHTHSGPTVFFPAAVRNEAIAAYEETLLPKAMQAAEAAVAATKPSILKESSCGIGMIALNRRDIFQLPDDLLTVVRIETPAGKVRGHLISFSCHPTVMSANNLEYSADLFGAAARHVESKYKGSFCIMFNGAAADLSTRFSRKKQCWTELDRIGKKLAQKIQELSNASEPLKAAPVAAKVLKMKLPFRAIVPLEKAQSVYEKAHKQYATITPLQENWEEKLKVLRANLEGASAQLLISRLGSWEPLFGVTEAELELQAIRFGDLIISGLPGEFFGRRGLDLHEAAHPKRGFIIGYANGYWGYVVPPDESQTGGYEAMMAPIDSKDEPKIMKQIKSLIKQLKAVKESDV